MNRLSHDPLIMKILAISQGSDRSEAALCAGLIEAGHTVEILEEGPGDQPSRLQDIGLPVTPVTLRSRIDRAGSATIRRQLAATPVDIIHAFSNRALSNALLASRGTPAKIVAYRGTIGHLSRWDPACRLAHLNSRVDRIVCVSDAVRHYMQSLRVPPDRLKTIYKGHDMSWYASNTASLEAFGIPPSALVVGFTGNIRPVKGVDVLLQAADMLTPEEDIHFLLVGDVRERKLKKRLRTKSIPPRVHFTGFRSDAAALSGACDLFVMPSLAREGLPRAVIEAMAQRVPPIVTDVGGMPELVKHDECGLIVPPRDPSALAGAIRSLANNRSKLTALGERAKERIEQHFNINQMLSKTLAMYQELLEP